MTLADMKNLYAKEKRSSKQPSSSLPNPVTLALGSNLKRYREDLGKTQVELAYDGEIERSRISKIECGYVNPSLLTLATLCYCLDITLPQLFEGITVTMPPTSHGGSLRRANQATLYKTTEKRRKRS